MSLIHDTVTRNAIVDAVTARIDTGTGAIIEIATSAAFTTILSTVPMSVTSFGAASTGVAVANGLPLSDSSAALSGLALRWRILTQAGGTQITEGSVGAIASGADMEITNVNITAGEQVNVTTFNYTAPA